MNRQAALKRRGLSPAEEAPRPPRGRLGEPGRLKSLERRHGMESCIHRLRISKATGRNHVCPVSQSTREEEIEAKPPKSQDEF